MSADTFKKDLKAKKFADAAGAKRSLSAQVRKGIVTEAEAQSIIPLIVKTYGGAAAPKAAVKPAVKAVKPAVKAVKPAKAAPKAAAVKPAVKEAAPRGRRRGTEQAEGKASRGPRGADVPRTFDEICTGLNSLDAAQRTLQTVNTPATAAGIAQCAHLAKGLLNQLSSLLQGDEMPAEVNKTFADMAPAFANEAAVAVPSMPMQSGMAEEDAYADLSEGVPEPGEG